MKVKSIASRLLVRKNNKLATEQDLDAPSSHSVGSLSKCNTSSHKLPLLQRQQQQQRSVCIQENLNIVHSIEHSVDLEEVLARWYTEEETIQLKEATLYTCKMIRRVSAREVQDQKSYMAALMAAYQASHKVTLPQQDEHAIVDALAEQFALWTPRAGLESRLVKAGCVSCSDKDEGDDPAKHRRQHLLGAVLKQQAQSQDAFKLAQTCQDISRPAIRFASLVGQAHLHATLS